MDKVVDLGSAGSSPVGHTNSRYWESSCSLFFTPSFLSYAVCLSTRIASATTFCIGTVSSMGDRTLVLQCRFCKMTGGT